MVGKKQKRSPQQGIHQGAVESQRRPIMVGKKRKCSPQQGIHQGAVESQRRPLGFVEEERRKLEGWMICFRHLGMCLYICSTGYDMIDGCVVRA